MVPVSHLVLLCVDRSDIDTLRDVTERLMPAAGYGQM
jgi:hypothetical protein